ncbi:hypothetical protein NDU88_002766 [Pleurodeles waltl]|uniref:Uncharacterized protein n=1 Tax=Pleurodeles waltl TaxID=8319 RepID=A0AAV7TM16_PLEWA|nr:hypothetical protein NDU88_002766 [Pleurodeles waltl]
MPNREWGLENNPTRLVMRWRTGVACPVSGGGDPQPERLEACDERPYLPSTRKRDVDTGDHPHSGRWREQPKDTVSPDIRGSPLAPTLQESDRQDEDGPGMGTDCR